MPTYKLQIARFPYGGIECTESVTWLTALSGRLASDRRFDVSMVAFNDTPITMTRNRAIVEAKRAGVDLLLLIDSDMAPDLYLGADPEARPFFESSVDFVLKHPGPCVVAAPYCGPPPHENVYVFTWADLQADAPDVDARIEQYTREQASMMSGVQRAAALPTGLMLIDLRAFDAVPHPFTYYEWKDEGPRCEACGCRRPGPQMEKASTEDVTLTRDLALAGVPQFCNWDAWAGHVKRKVVGRPRPVTSDMVANRMHEAIVARRTSGDRLIDVRPGRFEAAAAEALAEAKAARDLLVTDRHGVIQPEASSVSKFLSQAAPAPPAAPDLTVLHDLFALEPVRVA